MPKPQKKTKRVQILPKGWKVDYKDRKGVTHYVGPNNKTRTTPPPGTKYKNVKITPTKKKKPVKKRGKKYTISNLTSVSFVTYGLLDETSDYIQAITLSGTVSNVIEFNAPERPIKSAIDLNIGLEYPLEYLPEIRNSVGSNVINDNDVFLLYGQDVNEEKTVTTWTAGSTYTKGQRISYLGEIYEATTNITSTNTTPPLSFVSQADYYDLNIPGFIAGGKHSVISIKRSGNRSWEFVDGQNGLYRYDASSDMLKRINVEDDIRTYANSYVYCQATGKSYISDDDGNWDEASLSPERNPLTKVSIYGLNDLYDFDDNPIFKLSDAQAGVEPPQWSPKERYRGSYLSSYLTDSTSPDLGWLPGSLVSYQNDVYSCTADFWISGISPDNEDFWQLATPPGARVETTGIEAYKRSIVEAGLISPLIKVFSSLRPAKPYNIFSEPPSKPLSSAYFVVESDDYRIDAVSIVYDAWSVSTNYITNDIVEYNNEPYIAVLDSVGKNPSSDPAWQKTSRDVTTNLIYGSGSDIKFSIQTLGINNYTVEWNFGDGTTASGSSVTHKYMSGNTTVVQFDVTATVTSQTGEKFESSQPILIERMDRVIVGVPIVVGEG